MASNVRNQSEKIKFVEPQLAPLSPIKTGGSADFLSRPATLDQLKAVVAFAKREGLPITVLGALTNSLVSDRGIEGVAIHTVDLDRIRVQGSLIIAEGGVMMDRLIDEAIEHGLGGLEPLGGLPGTVGGAIYGNSGANGLLTADRLYWIDCLDREGNLIRFRAHPDQFAYRHSPFWGRSDLVIWEAAFKLDPITETNEARQQKEAYKGARREKGQYAHPSIGCIFRNPDGESAGRIIDSLGLKGTAVGGAVISPHHANFIVCEGHGATSNEIASLITLVKGRVEEERGTLLTEEIRYLGRW